MTYTFHPSQRVRGKYNGKSGEVTTCVPGNGSFPWYFVKWDDGTEDRYTESELE